MQDDLDRDAQSLERSFFGDRTRPSSPSCAQRSEAERQLEQLRATWWGSKTTSSSGG